MADGLNYFPRFFQLPGELRVLIWEFAIEESSFEPEAHFFAIHQPVVEVEHTSQVLDEGTSTGPSLNERLKTGAIPLRASRFAAILPPNTDPRSNPSGYVLNHGILNAFWESRVVVIKHWERIIRRCRPNPFQNSSICLWTGGTYPGRLSLAVRPACDLFVFQFPVMTDDNARLLVDLFFMKRQRGLLGGINNIALMYDCEWERQAGRILAREERWASVWAWDEFTQHQSSFGAFARLVEKIRDHPGRRQLSQLWLVDTSIEPRQGIDMSGLMARRPTFRGNGNTFVTIENFYDLRNFWGPQPQAAVENNAFNFVELIQEVLNEESDWADTGDGDAGTGAPSFSIKVLGCIPDNLG